MDLYGEFKKRSALYEHAGHALFWSWLDDYSADKHRLYLLASNFSVLGNALQYSLDYRTDLEYMNRHGLSWDDVHNPSKLSSSSSGSAFVRSGINFVSSNVKRLYR